VQIGDATHQNAMRVGDAEQASLALRDRADTMSHAVSVFTL
jgi:hypothetical protein